MSKYYRPIVVKKYEFTGTVTLRVHYVGDDIEDAIEDALCEADVVDTDIEIDPIYEYYDNGDEVYDRRREEE